MKPLYEHTGIKAGQLRVRVFAGLVIFLLGLLMGRFSSGNVVVIFIKIAGLFIGGYMIAFAPMYRIRAFESFVEIRFGFLGLRKFRIERSHVTNVEGLPDGAYSFFGGKRMNAELGSIPGWWIFVKNDRDPAIAIKSTGPNFLLGIPDPEKVEKQFRHLYGITTPGYMKLKDTVYTAVENPWEKTAG